MSKAKIQELKELDKMATRIARKKQRIEAQLKEEQETSKWYDQVLKESGFKRPKDFVKALMSHFGIRSVNLSGSKRGPGRPPKVKGTTPTGRRKRTKVTAEVRDKVKGILAKGNSMNAVSKQLGISYIVIKKIADGAYDKVK